MCSIAGLPRVSALPTRTRSGAGSRCSAFHPDLRAIPSLMELRRHRRIHVRIRTFDLVPELARERCDAAHECAADTEDVESHRWFRAQPGTAPNSARSERQVRDEPGEHERETERKRRVERAADDVRVHDEIPGDDRQHHPAEQRLQRGQLCGRRWHRTRKPRQRQDQQREHDAARDQRARGLHIAAAEMPQRERDPAEHKHETGRHERARQRIGSSAAERADDDIEQRCLRRRARRKASSNTACPPARGCSWHISKTSTVSSAARDSRRVIFLACSGGSFRCRCPNTASRASDSERARRICVPCAIRHR